MNADVRSLVKLIDKNKLFFNSSKTEAKSISNIIQFNQTIKK
jgi:hypothetical protein